DRHQAHVGDMERRARGPHRDRILDGAFASAPPGAREGSRPAHARCRNGGRRWNHHVARETNPQEIPRRRSEVRRHRDRVRDGVPMEGMKLAAAALALVAAGAARGEDVQWYLQVDNDVAFATDRWYTSGVHIARTHRASETARWEFGLAQEIYTPNTNDYQPDDRPYAARLFGYGAHHEYLPGRHRTLAVALGVLGESALGRQSQEFVHHFVPAPEDDWSRQLSDRPDVQAIGAQSDDLPFCPAGQCVVHYGAVLGNNLTFAH